MVMSFCFSNISDKEFRIFQIFKAVASLSLFRYVISVCARMVYYQKIQLKVYILIALVLIFVE